MNSLVSQEGIPLLLEGWWFVFKGKAQVDSRLTLFEISTTEGWVDVMYSAADSMGPYVPWTKW